MIGELTAHFTIMLKVRGETLMLCEDFEC